MKSLRVRGENIPPKTVKVKKAVSKNGSRKRKDTTSQSNEKPRESLVTLNFNPNTFNIGQHHMSIQYETAEPLQKNDEKMILQQENLILKQEI